MRPMPSTCPCTIWPPKRASARIGRSRFTIEREASLPRLVRSSVSRDISAENRFPAIVRTVRQTPFTAMLDPICKSSKTPPPRTKIVRKSPVSMVSTISPISSMIPVNICSQYEIGTRMGDRPAADWNRFGQTLDANPADRRDLAPAQDPGCHKGHYLINDAGRQGIESQIRPTFQQKALNFAGIQFGRELLEGPAKDQGIRKPRNPVPPVEDHAQQGAPAGQAAAVGQLRIVGKDSSAAGNECVGAMAQPVNHRARLPGRDPSGFAVPRGNLTIERHRDLQNAERAALSLVNRECFVELPGFTFEDAGLHGYSRSPKHFQAFAVHFGIGVLHCGDDSSHAGVDKRFGAGGSPAPGGTVGAGFEVGVDRGASRCGSCLFEGDDLRVPDAVIGIEAFADDAAVLYDDATDHHSGAGQACASFRQFQRAPDVVLRSLCLLWFVLHAANSDSTKSSAENSIKSSIFSPTPTKRIGILSSFAMAVTTPPFAVPSSFVRTRPVTPALFVNSLACVRPFCPVVASSTSRTSCGAPGTSRLAMRFIFSSSAIRLCFVCSRPAVSTMT